MRVLVTGGAGFLGSHVVDHLIDLGHDVSVLDNLSTGRLDNVNPSARFFMGDVRYSLENLFRGISPEVVVHLAAQVSVPASISDPCNDQDTNIGGTCNVLLAAARSGARKIISVSSAAVYGNPERVPVSENHHTAPLSPYGLSKLTGEHYVRLLCELYGLDFTILRPANIYGPRQTIEGEGAVVPAFLARFMNGLDPVIHGDGSQTRDFIFVNDMAAAIIRTLTHGSRMTLNVSSMTRASVGELWRLLARMVGWKRDPVHGPAREGDIQDSVMNNALAIKYLDWKPTVSLAEGLATTVAWSKREAVATADH